MSVQFGKCNLDGKPVDPADFEEVRPVLAPYGPDDEGFICRDNFAILYRAFHSTKESRRERQPFALASGAVITWDGRLDNREELIATVASGLSQECTDVEIVAAAYQRWRAQSFARLIGDWALSIWDPKDRCLILAKDFVGVRHLYYLVDKNQVTWCTILDPLVLFAGHSFELNEEYVAGWLTLFPAPHLTPYVAIQSVPPSTLVCLEPEAHRVIRYWDFNPTREVTYSSDSEYEEHFRSVFGESVRRRLRSDTPIAAELSGGMDSSSIVCIADNIVASTGADARRLHTISYYDDSDPNWNERPYLEAVERKRSCAGLHVKIGLRGTVAFEPEASRFVALPASALARDEAASQTAAHLLRNGIRVLLSGIGGDEVTGGVPTPMPELADLVVTTQFRRLAQQLKAWALFERRPWHYLLWEALREFLPIKLSNPSHPVPWISREFAKRYKRALSGYPRRLTFSGALPSFQEDLCALDFLRRQLGVAVPSPQMLCEARYAYLDRDFLEFMYSIPREQIIRPGQRRSLMRRALKGIVPEEVLTRRRKSYVTRQPANLVAERLPELRAVANYPTSKRIEWIDSETLVKWMSGVQSGDFTKFLPLIRTILFEVWLRGATDQGRVKLTPKVAPQEKRRRFSSNELEIQEKGG